MFEMRMSDVSESQGGGPSFWTIETLKAIEKAVRCVTTTVLPAFPAWHRIFKTQALPRC